MDEFGGGEKNYQAKKFIVRPNLLLPKKNMEKVIEEANSISSNYGKVVTKLLDEVEASTTLPEIEKLFLDFSKKCTMIPKLWLKWLEFQRDPNFDIGNWQEIQMRERKIKAEARKHFCHYKFFEWQKSPLEKDGTFEECLWLDNDNIYFAVNIATNIAAFENGFSFPNFSLEKLKNLCERHGTRPIPLKVMKKYRESQEIVNGFITSDGMLVKDWKEKLAEFSDQNFVIKSFEYFLGEHPSDKNAWKFCVNYLKLINERLTLNTFSRYCGLFTDHLEMRKEYIQWVEQIHSSLEDGCLSELSSFQNLRFSSRVEPVRIEPLDFSIRVNSESSFESNRFFSSSKSTQTPTKPYYIRESEIPSSMHFSPKNIIRQKFALPFDGMNCIISTCNFVTKQKLYQSCKFFYQKSQKPLCHRLGICDDFVPTYYDQSLFLNSTTFNFAGLEGAILTNSMQIILPKNPNATSIILSKLSECHVLSIALCRQNLTEWEFDRLVGGRMRRIQLEECLIRNAKDEIIPVEEIMAKIPNAHGIVIFPYPSMITLETAEKIGKLQRPKNLIHLTLSEIPHDFSETIFVFFKIHALQDSYLRLIFEAGVEKEVKENFLKRGKEILDGIQCEIKIE